MMKRGRIGGGVLLVAWCLSGSVATATPDDAKAFLASIQPSPELQAFLDRTVDELAASDANLRRVNVYIALLDLPPGSPPQLAQRRGREPVYPASVVKFAYLMAAYAWQEKGVRDIDPEMDQLLKLMIHDSDNHATQAVVARLTGTAPGETLSPAAYHEFRERRLVVERWLRTLGIDDLHCVNPTYDGSDKIEGREKQFLTDHSFARGRSPEDYSFANRNTMSAVGTAELLALLATDRALSPASSADVRRRMHRDIADQPHLVHRIAGGAARAVDLQVYSKSGTWGPIYADAGIVQHTSGRQFVLVVLTSGTPPYHGDFIADLTYRAAQHLLGPSAETAAHQQNTGAAPDERWDTGTPEHANPP